MLEWNAVEDAVQLFANGLLVGVAPANARNDVTLELRKRKSARPLAFERVDTVTYYDQQWADTFGR